MADVAASHPFPTPGVRSASFFGDYKSVEEERLQESEKKVRHWKRWGPYLSERQWATVREDYSANGDAWTHFPHDHARSRTYRWGEDGLGGVSDNHGRLCFSMALWNGVDPILKERLFGTTGHQGNHGEDVKELYYYLDSSPTHSYMRYLYKYPQRPYPYEQLIRESTNRSRDVGEFEITDTDAFDDNKYWDVFVEVSLCSVFRRNLIWLNFVPWSPLTTVRQRLGQRERDVDPDRRLQPGPRAGDVAHRSAAMVPKHVVVG